MKLIVLENNFYIIDYFHEPPNYIAGLSSECAMKHKKKYFFSTKTYVVGAQSNRLNERFI